MELNLEPAVIAIMPQGWFSHPSGWRIQSLLPTVQPAPSIEILSVWQINQREDRHYASNCVIKLRQHLVLLTTQVQVMSEIFNDPLSAQEPLHECDWLHTGVFLNTRQNRAFLAPNMTDAMMRRGPYRSVALWAVKEVDLCSTTY